MKMTVAVTGFSGYFSRALWPLLRDDEAIEHIIGIDVRPPSFPTDVPSEGKATFHEMDVRDTDRLAHVLSEADVVVHLAFVMMRLPGSDGDLDEINQSIFHSVVEASFHARVRKLIVMSSVMAYGVWPDNPIPLTETAPLRPNPDLYYSRIKATIERELSALEAAHPEVVITWLRPCTVIGPQADKGMMAMLTTPVMPAVWGSNLPYQVVHEKDLAQAIHLIIHKDAPGAYNVAADEVPRILDLVRETGGKVIPLPATVIKTLMALMWRTGKSIFAPEWVVLFQHPLVVNSDKLKALGWKPTYTSKSAFVELRTERD
jgi:UDP-glucose 4-epimerase